MKQRSLRDRIQGIGVRTRLTLLVLLGMAPLLALIFAGATQDRVLTLDKARIRATELALYENERLNDAFLRAESFLPTLRVFAENETLEEARCNALMAQLHGESSSFLTIGIVGSDNVDICHSVDNHHKYFGDTDLVKVALTRSVQKVSFGHMVVGAASHKRTIFAALPFHRRAAPTEGIVFVSFDLERFAALAEQEGREHAMSVLLIDLRDGKLVVRAPQSPPPNPTGIAPTLLLDAIRASSQPGTVETHGVDNIVRLFGFTRFRNFEDTGFAVAVGLPREAILADADARFVTAAALAAVASALALAAAWIFGDWTQLRPVKNLVCAAQRLGAGDLQARAVMSGWQAPEFRLLAAGFSDMAERTTAARADLAESERHLRMLADNSTDMITCIDADGRRSYVSPASRTLLGYEPAEWLRKSVLDTVHPDDMSEVVRIMTARARQSLHRYRLRRKDDRYVWVEATARSVDAGISALGAAVPGPVVPGLVVVVRDISERVAAEQKLKESEARYRILAEHATDMVFQLDREQVRSYVSPACRDMLGFEPEDLIGRRPTDRAHPDDIATLQNTFKRLLDGDINRASTATRIRHRLGHWVWVEAEMRAVSDPTTGRVKGIVGALRDITVRKKIEEQLEAKTRELETLATRDALTGLANRRAFDAALHAALTESEGKHTPLSLVLIDVDRFKAFNDLYGHQAGDECLRAISLAIEDVVETSQGLPARYGGEELAVLLPCCDVAAAHRVAERICLSVSGLRNANTGETSRAVSVSAGVACLDATSPFRTASELVRMADQALYAAKRAGRNTVRVYTQPEAVENVLANILPLSA